MFEASGEAKESGFSAPAFPDEGQDFSGGRGQVDLVDGRQGGFRVGFADLPELDGGTHGVLRRM